MEDSRIEGIKDFINYKYPILPNTDIAGQILCKVDSKWDDGALDEMKERTKSRQGSPKSRTFNIQKLRSDSINFQDFKSGKSRLNSLDASEVSTGLLNQTGKTLHLNTTRNKTTDRYGNGQGQGG